MEFKDNKSNLQLWRVLPKDTDEVETSEWIQSFRNLKDIHGHERATFILRKLLDEARDINVPLPPVLNTPYKNTISIENQPAFPGDLEIENKISAMVRWNALVMVVKANKFFPELGGHIATFTSSADLFEVGFNHFFKGGDNGDCVYFQPHSAPGIYARAFLEGRLGEDKLLNYRRGSKGNGLSSYCHPWLMPDFWQFPTGSMGLGPLTSIYQARFMKYLNNREILDTNDRKVWCFVGDGEMDEPESLAGLSIASRENLDNLVFVVNCNLQRLDGPVRGNGSIVQELEGLFAGAGWNVIKVLWGSDWDLLFARDKENLILKRLHEMVDGELQTYAAMDGRFNKEHVFQKYPDLFNLVKDLSDTDIDKLQRGGHDPIKIFAAYHRAKKHKNQPTVILAQTKKGYGMGHWGQGKMSAHQQKKLTDEALFAFRDKFNLDITDDEVKNLNFIKFKKNSREEKYLLESRLKLGGFLPKRVNSNKNPIKFSTSPFEKFFKGSNGREISTTMVFVNLLTAILNDKNISKFIVPIVADEARTFGLQSLFRKFAIYSPFGQLYSPEDKEELLYYKESKNGQILEEGINEAGAISSWIAAGTSYANHGVPMIPFYIFYSCFGFQRIGDLIWSAGDSRAKGFLLGATAGRTTLSGEGLQHEDGSSHILFSTVPNCVAYDPAYGYELSVIIENGFKRMYEDNEDVFYYITVMNENYIQPEMPKNSQKGIINGMYRLLETPKNDISVQLMGSGTILNEVIKASRLLHDDWDISSTIWSVTSYTELRKNALECEKNNTINTNNSMSWIEECFTSVTGPFVAATDYMSSLPDMISRWIPGRYYVLGTDGYGRSDTRENLRDFFEVSAKYICFYAINALINEGKIEKSIRSKVIKKYQIDTDKKISWLS